MEKKITVMKLFGVLLTPTCQKLDALEILDVIFCVVETVGVESDECLITEDKTITWFVIAK